MVDATVMEMRAVYRLPAMDSFVITRSVCVGTLQVDSVDADNDDISGAGMTCVMRNRRNNIARRLGESGLCSRRPYCFCCCCKAQMYAANAMGSVHCGWRGWRVFGDAGGVAGACAWVLR